MELWTHKGTSKGKWLWRIEKERVATGRQKNRKGTSGMQGNGGKERWRDGECRVDGVRKQGIEGEIGECKRQ